MMFAGTTSRKFQVPTACSTGSSSVSLPMPCAPPSTKAWLIFSPVRRALMLAARGRPWLPARREDVDVLRHVRHAGAFTPVAAAARAALVAGVVLARRIGRFGWRVHWHDKSSTTPAATSRELRNLPPADVSLRLNRLESEPEKVAPLTQKTTRHLQKTG